MMNFMEIAIQVIWWIGLIWALIATGILLKLVSLLLAELSAISRLAVITRDAAAGIAANTEQLASFKALGSPAQRVAAAAERQANAIAAIEEKSRRWRKD